jgi:hypothetical protein
MVTKRDKADATHGIAGVRNQHFNNGSPRSPIGFAGEFFKLA